MNRPWMPLYIADYLADTTRLSTIEHGAYVLLIMEYWRNGGLPDNDRQLANIAKLSLAQWKKMRPIIQGFFRDGWRHKRIDDELAHAAEVSNKRKAAAEEKHRQKAANASANDDAKAPPFAGAYEHTLHTPQSTKEEKDIGAVAKATRPPDPVFLKFWKAYPKREGANPRAPAEKLFLSAVKSGVDGERIVAAIEARVGFDPAKVGTEYIPQAVKWLRDKRWEDAPQTEQPSEKNREEMAARGWEWDGTKWVKTAA